MRNRDRAKSLEFDKVLDAIAGFANSDASRQAILATAPLPGRGAVELRFGQVTEIRRLLQAGVPLALAPFQDLSSLIEQLRPAGAVLDPRDLLVFIPPLRIMYAMAKQLAYRQDVPLLKELASELTGFPELLESLEGSIDHDGAILDSASQKLFELRGRIRALSGRIRKRLEELVRERRIAPFLQDDFITQRSGRWVIPVRMDAKGEVAGVVHDVSGSGETAFMEPLEIIGLANELENLAAEEKAEQIRILRELCRWLREDADAIEAQFASIVQLDLLNSIACFADSLRAEVPTINDGSTLRLVGARHPLLLLLQKERGGAAVVPLDLTLGDGATAQRVMVITGPNAGGKTISLKTTGLLLLMALSGIPVPAAATSTFPFASKLLVDIGDEQSIESSLSTFSAHVTNIAGILQQADERTVVLLDEVGTGTEPVQGAAIACAVLRELLQQGALVVATTHLTDIVGYVHKTAGMVNAAMEFDSATFTPLYRLKCGEPGQSHALEIARRYGLPDRIIESARGMLGRMESEFHALLAELKEKRQSYEELLAELAGREQTLAERERLAAERLAAAQLQQREAQEKGYLEARDIIRDARREVSAILDEARREKSREAKKKLEEAEREMEERLRQFHPEARLALEELAEGDTVFVTTINYDGTITAIDRRQGRLRVRAGNMELDVALADLASPRGKGAKPEPRRGKTAVEEEAAYQLNIVGLRVDDALPQLERFLNRASLDQIGEVRIIHGKGTGALMKGVRDYLTGHPLVGSFRSGEPFAGGTGVTVVTLR